MSLVWFRKGLRLHDNAALVEACKAGSPVYPLFIIDPHFASPAHVGAVRYRFLLQSLEDLDQSLRKHGSRLFVAKGTPKDVLPDLVKQWSVKKMCYEKDTEPFAKKRDSNISAKLRSMDVKVSPQDGHMLHDIDEYVGRFPRGETPRTYGQFRKIFASAGHVPLPLEVPEKIPSPECDVKDSDMRVPTMAEMGYTEELGPELFKGGETHALARLNENMENKAWICAFEKPKTAPTALEPDTTGLSPYMKFGCLSSRTFWHTLHSVYADSKKEVSKPPVSLTGQLLWREFNYTVASVTPCFDRMVGNPLCRQIPWADNEEYFNAWKEARTGYPFIDAIQIQLRQEGWIHHLARHATACFLTRGDLWQSWEKGQRVFELYLIDADWSINAFNWMWLSCSSFFYQYFRCYSPIAFGKKTDPEGLYIRKYLPILKDMPKKYIYEPWKAPLKVQQQVGCVIGKDYPEPIVDHAVVSKENMKRMADAYKNQEALRDEFAQQEEVDWVSVFSTPPASGERERPEADAPHAKKQKTG